jgi:hypothetical protein
MTGLFRTTVVEISGVRTIAGGGTNASNAGQALLNLGGVSITGNQTITGQKIFQDKLLVGLTTPDAATPDNILQTNSLTIAGVDITAGGQVPSTVIKGGVFLGKSDGSLGILTNSSSVWGPSAFEFAGVNFDVTAYNNMYFTAGYFPQLWLDTNGNVGIDTAYPSERLEVNGNVLANNLVYNTGNQTISGIKTFITVNESFLVLSITNQTINIPLNSGMNFILPLTTGITGVVFSNAPSNLFSFTLRVDYSGVHSVIWPTGIPGRILWPGGTAPTLTSISGKEDLFTFLTYNSGTEFFGIASAQNF